MNVDLFMKSVLVDVVFILKKLRLDRDIRKLNECLTISIDMSETKVLKVYL